MTINPNDLHCPCAACGGSAVRVGPGGALVKLLEKMETQGPLLRITSGVRCRPHNKAIGGAEGSYHVTGLAADIACTDSVERCRLVRAAIVSGARFIEVATRHVHVDMRPNIKPQLVTGVSR